MRLIVLSCQAHFSMGFSVFRFSSIMILKICITLCLFSCLNNMSEMLSAYHLKELIVLERNLVYPSLYSFDLDM